MVQCVSECFSFIFLDCALWSPRAGGELQRFSGTGVPNGMYYTGRCSFCLSFQLDFCQLRTSIGRTTYGQHVIVQS